MFFDKYFANHNCMHDWRITQVSNAVQFDELGYPMRLCIQECERCGKSDQAWCVDNSDVADQIKSGDAFLLKWRHREDY